MDEKHDPTICSLQEAYFRPEDIRRMKVKGGEKNKPYKNNQKRTVVALLISDKISLKSNCYKRQKIFYTLIKGSICQENMAIINIRASKNKGFKK